MILGPLEEEVMLHMWRVKTPQGCDDMRLMLEKAYAYTTVMTIMSKLYGKGFLSREKQGRSYIYSVKKSKETYIKDVIKPLIYDIEEKYDL